MTCCSAILAAGAGCAKFTAVELDGRDSGVVYATPPNPDEVFSFNIGTIPRLVQGTTTTIPITLTRSGPKKSDISVVLKDAPTGVAANPLIIVRGVDSGELQITVSQDVPQGALDNKTWIEGRALDATAYARADFPLFVRGPAGSLDTTFATGGRTIDVFNNWPGKRFNAFVSADDHIFMVGACRSSPTVPDYTRFCLARLTRKVRSTQRMAITASLYRRD